MLFKKVHLYADSISRSEVFSTILKQQADRLKFSDCQADAFKTF